jgi:hypothetical protein
MTDNASKLLNEFTGGIVGRVEELGHKGRSHRGSTLLPTVQKDPQGVAREIEEGPRAEYSERSGVTYWEFLLNRGYIER